MHSRDPFLTLPFNRQAVTIAFEGILDTGDPETVQRDLVNSDFFRLASEKHRPLLAALAVRRASQAVDDIEFMNIVL